MTDVKLAKTPHRKPNTPKSLSLFNKKRKELNLSVSQLPEKQLLFA